MTYKEVNPTVWTYKNEGDFIEGIYVSVQEKVGPNESMLYSINTPDKGVLSVWGARILDQRMAIVPVDSKVKITFMGLSKQAQKGHSPAKIFKVEVDED
jgi:hypothetical protein